MSPAPQSSLCVLDDSERKHLGRLVKTNGLAGAARLLGISRGVIAAAVGGIGVRRGSFELVRDALKTQAKGAAK